MRGYNMEHVLKVLPGLMEVPSPSGFTGMAADFVMKELKEMGYDPELSRKGCVLTCLGRRKSAYTYVAYRYARGDGCRNKTERKA